MGIGLRVDSLNSEAGLPSQWLESWEERIGRGWAKEAESRPMLDIFMVTESELSDFQVRTNPKALSLLQTQLSTKSQ